jgi:polyisoprenoid-binding protein YceI
MKLLISCILLIATLQSDTWKVTKADIQFTIKHGFGTTADGDFKLKEAKIVFNPTNLAQTQIDATVLTTTISTGLGIRDKVLRKADYFACEQYPEMSLKYVGGIKSVTKNQYTGQFKLKIKATEKLLTLPFTATIAGDKAQFATQFTINRLDYKVGESSFALGDDVKVEVKVEALR